ncbi:Hypothetical protein MVR_LOCUS338 [uncultured virus]|nr:Hypothetical protein MVR_LOCUS338 [uncultured virus]
MINPTLDQVASFANQYHQAFPTHHIYDPITCKYWYIDNINIWNIDRQGSYLKTSITTHMPNCPKFIVAKVFKQLTIKYAATNPKPVTEKFNNINPFLFAFTNGVMDLDNNVFRLPHPDEYVLGTCGYHFTPLNRRLHYTKEQLKQAIGQMVQSSQDLIELLVSISHALDNTTPPHLNIWQGNIGHLFHSNGQGMLHTLISKTFGFYCFEYDTNRNISNQLLMNRYAKVIMISSTITRKMNVYKLNQLVTTRHIDHTVNNTIVVHPINATVIMRVNGCVDTLIDVDDAKVEIDQVESITHVFPFSFVDGCVGDTGNDDYLKPAHPITTCSNVAVHYALHNCCLSCPLEDYDYKMAFFHLLLEYYWEEGTYGQLPCDDQVVNLDPCDNMPCDNDLIYLGQINQSHWLICNGSQLSNHLQDGFK